MGKNVRLPDFIKEPYIEYCEVCCEYVISLCGHCINNDKHKTFVLTLEEREKCFIHSGKKVIKDLKINEITELTKFSVKE